MPSATPLSLEAVAPLRVARRGRSLFELVPLWLALAVAAPALWGCAGDYVARTRAVRQSYESYHYDEALAAISALEKEGSSKEPSIDTLLILLDKGMILHSAGRFEESIQVLAAADSLSQQLDFTSVSEEAKSLISSEREKTYRGEDFEKLMISVLQALNYSQLGKDEDALVEVRRVNERIRKMINDDKKPYEQLAIARYLGGVLYEDQGNEDSAFIDYQDAARLQPALGALASPLLRLAEATGREDAYKELRKKYPEADGSPLKKGEGQLVAVVEVGRVPEKVSTDRRHGSGSSLNVIAVPSFQNRWRRARAKVSVEGGPSMDAVTLTSLENVAKLHLDDRVGRLVAKQLAGAALKAGIATGIGKATKSTELGVIAFLAMAAINQPDLRSWLSLPAEFQVARFRLPAGNHSVSLDVAGRPTQHTVKIQSGRITLLVSRLY